MTSQTFISAESPHDLGGVALTQHLRGSADVQLSGS